MGEHDRERELRRRLAAYAERQARRAAELDRLNAGLLAAERGSSASAQAQVQAVADADPAQAYEPLIPRTPASGLPAVTIAVPIHDAVDELERCLWSLARNTTYPATLLLLDDASTHPRIDSVLDWAVRLENVRVLRNVQNMGFPATVNRALRASTGDLVLLNSDTEVGPRWLEQLVLAAYADAATGTVTPLSDSAGAFSAPLIDATNPLPLNLGVDDVARLVAGEATGERPHTPTGNGFCMYIKRPLIGAVGEMDAVRFGRGYGEENDYCMRAGRLGWRHIVDDGTFVHHEREASFGEAKRLLAAAARRELDELHPDYTARVAEFIADPGMARARERVAAALARGASDGPPRPRLLFVIHEGGGGAIATNRDLMGALAAEYECYSFSSDRKALRLWRVDGAASELLEQWELERPLLLGDLSRPDYRDAFAAALDRVSPELVHIRHLFKHTFDPPRMTAARELPTVLSFHDHYFLCPTIHLLDERGRYCYGTCTPGAGACPTVRAGTLPVLKHAFVYQWREEVEAALASIDAFVTTATHTRDIHTRFLRATRGKPFELVEHGRDLLQLQGLARAPEPGGRVRILIPAHLDRHKGADLIDAMTKLDRDARLDLHFLGEVPARYEHLGTVHGAYERDHLAERIRDLGPAFVGVFSTTAESYSHTITEAWAAGVPVLATDLGAQAERVGRHGGGFVISHDDPARALAQVLAAADDPDAYARQAAQADAAELPSVADMAARYASLYRGVIDRRRQFATAAASPGDPFARGLWRTEVIVTPEWSADGLTSRRLWHPSVLWKLRPRMRTWPARLDDDADLVLVAPGAVAADAVPAFLEQLSAPLALLVPDRPDEAFEELMGAAELLIAPTDELAAAYGRRHPNVAVLSPALDERVLPAGEPAPPVETRATGGVLVVSARFDDEERALIRALGDSSALEIVTWASSPQPEPGIAITPAPDPEADYPGYVEVLAAAASRAQVALALGGSAAEAAQRYVEYAALGVPGVYCVTEDRGIREGGGGLVCAADAAALAQEIGRLRSEPGLAQDVRDAAWRDVVPRRLMRERSRELLQVIGSVLTASAAGGDPQPDRAGLTQATVPGDGG